jgi:hypothetical protein
MAYYGGYSNAYPGQQYSMSYGIDPSSQQQQQSYAQQYGGYSSGLAAIPQATTPSATAQTQPTASSSYKINLPAYYAGPSYSTTSDNDFNFNSLPVVGNNNNINNNSQMGAYGPQDPSQTQPQSSYDVSSDPYAQYGGYATNNQQHQQQQQQQPQSSRSHRSSSSQQAPLLSGADDFSQLAPQIEAAYEAATHHRRQPVIKRQVITVPGTPGKIQQVVRRLPTPTPDIVERVFIVKPQRDVVNLVIERPGTPPAQYKDRTVMGKQRRPLINPRIIRVAPRQNSLSGYYQYPFQQQQQQQQQQQYYPGYYQQQQQPQYQQYVHALPAPSPLLNVQTVRIPPSSSSTYQNYQQQQQPQQQSLPDQQHLVSSGLEQQSQGQVSQAQISQHSQQQHSQSQVHMLPPQSQSQSQQPLLSSAGGISGNGGISSGLMGPKGYLIAPVQYDDQLLSNNPYNFAQGMMMNQMMQQQQQQPQGYGQGYSTGFPSQGFSAMPASAYPVYGR